jgi:uncharacterized protein
MNENERLRTGTAAGGASLARIELQPIAAPSILGLYGFAGATFMVAANMAQWFGGPQTPRYLFPFAAMFGGLAQFLAGMWAFKARDGLATAMHGTWGAFWLGYGLLNTMFAVGLLPQPPGAFPALGFWFIVLAAITWAGAFAALTTTVALTSVLTTLAAGSTLMAIVDLTNNAVLRIATGYVFMVSAVLAWYTATAMMLEETHGRSVLPVGKTHRAREKEALSLGLGEPGVAHGQ